MSIHALSWAMRQTESLSSSEKFVLICLADMANDEGECWPSQNTIHEKTLLSRQTVNDILKRLEAKQYITSTRNYDRSGREISKTYWLVLVRPEPVTESGKHPPGVSQDDTPGVGNSDTSKENRHYLLEPDTRFSRFWEVYPKKKSKGDAEKAFKAIKVDDALLAAIISAIERAKETDQWQKDYGQYIPYPASWLRAKGWEDETVEKEESHPEYAVRRL